MVSKQMQGESQSIQDDLRELIDGGCDGNSANIAQHSANIEQNPIRPVRNTYAALKSNEEMEHGVSESLYGSPHIENGRMEERGAILPLT